MLDRLPFKGVVDTFVFLSGPRTDCRHRRKSFPPFPSLLSFPLFFLLLTIVVCVCVTLHENVLIVQVRSGSP